MLAEESLHILQQTLLRQAPPASAETRAQSLTRAEDRYGATAVAEGRALRDLLHGSAAWELFERPLPGGSKSRLPRAPGLTRSEAVLDVMRDSGELAERERLLAHRDALLREYGAAPIPEPERSYLLRETYDAYFTDVTNLADRYSPLYLEMRRAVSAIPDRKSVV